MIFSYSAQEYFEKIVSIAYRKYSSEAVLHPYLEIRSEGDFSAWFNEKICGAEAVIAVDNGMAAGFILYWLDIDNRNSRCYIPVWGYGADSTNTMDRLFQRLAERVTENGGCTFNINTYANDVKTRELLSLLQFGTICERGVRHVEVTQTNTAYKARAIGKEELASRWKEIWLLLSKLIEHLKKSPVFYPGTEFTEEVYKGFFTDENTTVYIAEDNGKIIGIIESNTENEDLIFPSKSAVNIGEAYVIPEYRGFGVAQALLFQVENDILKRGTEFCWVEHGTANPTARGFWNKYFDTFSYTMTRTVEL